MLHALDLIHRASKYQIHQRSLVVLTAYRHAIIFQPKTPTPSEVLNHSQ